MPSAMPTSARLSPPARWLACTESTGRIRNRPNMRRPNTPARLAPARSSAALMRSGVTVGLRRENASRYSSKFRFFGWHLGLHSHPRRAYAQPEEPERRAAAQPPRGHHRAFWLGQELARVRYALCGVSGPLVGVALGVLPEVPRSDGEAVRRPHRSPFARDRHRAEGRRP